MSLEDAVNSGIRAHDQMHAPCEAEIARLRAAIKSLQIESDGYFERFAKAEAVVQASEEVIDEASATSPPSMGAIERLAKALAAYRERA